jgi:flagellar protein FlgJ
MSGHNVGFIPASTNFQSYDTTVSIVEKQNIVVVDQAPKSQDAIPLAQTDSVPLPKEVPVVGSKPVSNPIPPTEKTDAQTDEEEMPEREDLEESMIVDEEVIVLPVTLIDNSNNAIVPAEVKTKTGQKNITKSTPNNKGSLYVNTYYDDAKKAGDMFGLDPIIILAQGSFESDWGTSVMVKASNNFFGVTAAGKTNDYWNGAIYQSRAGNKLKFRSYNTPELSFKDFARLIKSKYKDAYSVSGNYKSYANKIANSPYISEQNGDNRENYMKAVISRYEKIKSLIK